MIREHKAKYIFIATVSVLAIIWAMFWPIGNKLTLCVTYGDIADGTSISACSEYNSDGYEETGFYKGSTEGGVAYVNLRWNHDGMTGLMIRPTDGSTPVLMNSVRIFLGNTKGDTLICEYDPALVMDKFDIVDGKWSMDESGLIRISPDGENCAIVTKDSELADAIQNVDGALKKQTRLYRFSTTVLILVLAWLAFIHSDRLFAYFEGLDKWSIASILAVIVAGASVWTIAFKSGIVHPDEDDVVRCLNWALTHFFPPDMRWEEVAGTYSGYGYTKLSNSTWYFLIAGKIAWIAGKLWPGILYYRVPNVIMLVVMTYIYIREIGRKKWLTLVLGISAQAWYIFSYTTADAMDFFLCFIALVILTDEDSILYKTVQEKTEIKVLWRHLILGVLFGFIFLGKPNYWAILALAFVILLFKLFDEEKEGRRGLLINYGVIVGFFALTVLTRYAFDLYHYGFGIGAAKNEMDVLHAAYDKNPTTPVNDIAVTYRMFRYGHPFSELFMAAPTWFRNTYRSFCGLLGDATTNDVYYKIMGILYGFVTVCLAYFGFKSKEDTKGRVKLVIMFVIFAAGFVASMVNSYVSDSQPQGRYLLPMLFTASYIAYETPALFEKKYFKTALIALQVLSAWYFAVRGVLMFA